jgi:hypothetical protein
MFTSKNWQSKTALLMALGFTSTTALPALLAESAIASEPIMIAQLFSQPAQVVIEAGTVIPVRYDEAEKIVVLPDETAPVTLTVAADVRSARGTIVIPQGSLIEGELRPTENGTQFVASEVVYVSSDRRVPIDAVSDVITDTEIITEESDPDILRGAAIGAAAAAVLSEIFGDIDFIEVIAGAGLGALAAVLLGGRKEEVEVVVVYPESDLDLTLQSDFALE